MDKKEVKVILQLLDLFRLEDERIRCLQASVTVLKQALAKASGDPKAVLRRFAQLERQFLRADAKAEGTRTKLDNIASFLRDLADDSGEPDA